MIAHTNMKLAMVEPIVAHISYMVAGNIVGFFMWDSRFVAGFDLFCLMPMEEIDQG